MLSWLPICLPHSIHLLHFLSSSRIPPTQGPPASPWSPQVRLSQHCSGPMFWLVRFWAYVEHLLWPLISGHTSVMLPRTSPKSSHLTSILQPCCSESQGNILVLKSAQRSSDGSEIRGSHDLRSAFLGISFSVLPTFTLFFVGTQDSTTRWLNPFIWRSELYPLGSFQLLV